MKHKEIVEVTNRIGEIIAVKYESGETEKAFELVNCLVDFIGNIDEWLQYPPQKVAVELEKEVDNILKV